MIEAMACGTPTIAWNNGSAPEIIDHSVTGIIVSNESDAVEVVSKARHLDRRLIRRVFEDRFSAAAMASKYVALYERMVQPTRLLKGVRSGLARRNRSAMEVVPAAAAE